MMPMIIIKYRLKKTIIQMQLDDFVKKKAITTFKMWIPRDYMHVRKHLAPLIKVRQYNRRCPLKPRRKKHRGMTLDDYMKALSMPRIPKPPYLFRFRSIPRYLREDHADGIISEREWAIIHALPTFTGYFDDVLLLNDLSILDDIQECLEKKGISFKNVSLHDVFLFEFSR